MHELSSPPQEIVPIKELITVRKTAILASSGVGKTTLVGYLKTLYPQLIIADMDDYTSNVFDGTILNSLTGIEKFTYWCEGELLATQEVVRDKADLIFGLMNGQKSRDYLEEHGYTICILSLPEDQHRTRIDNRFKTTGRIVDINGCLEGQRHLESLGYTKIDANRKIEDIARDIITFISPMHCLINT